ncbi:Hypothetical_protein [Hexamita inflata]|uniref:Hypothetical_protein n=1 Tax=Hexamita inflata TaxID=28002 RepID=A0ABP1HAF7_9EUKA
MQSVDVEGQSFCGQRTRMTVSSSRSYDSSFGPHLQRPLSFDCSTRIHGSYNLLEYVENSHLLRAVRSCLLISNLFFFKKELIQLLKVPQSSQMRPRSSYYSIYY